MLRSYQLLEIDCLKKARIKVRFVSQERKTKMKEPELVDPAKG